MSMWKLLKKMIHCAREYADPDFIIAEFREELKAEFPELSDREIAEIVA